MSLIVERFLICDYCGERHGVDTRSYSGKQHRKSAADDGWTHVGRKDYCEPCSSPAKEAHRE